MMIIDLLGILPFLSTCSAVRSPCDLAGLRLFRLFRLLKLLRYSPALQTLEPRRSPTSIARCSARSSCMLMLMLFARPRIYFLERDAQPDKFGSIPAAAWWALWRR